MRSREITPESLKDVCIYATGSIGRGEASQHSDLDVFILDTASDPAQRMSRLDGITMTAGLIAAASDNEFRKFSRDGEFLQVHVLDDLLKILGSDQDDFSNFFTARMLLLLESRCLAHDAAYVRAIERIVDVYWRDYAGRERTFQPRFLANDLMRFWKTLCLNYEAAWSTRPGVGDPSRAGWDAARRVANLKLGFSRLWTCNTGIAYLVAAARRNGVPPAAAIDMAALTPRRRMLHLSERHADVRSDVDTMLRLYDWFLKITDQERPDLESWLSIDKNWDASRDKAKKFGDAMYRAIHTVGAGGSLLRYLLV